MGRGGGLSPGDELGDERRQACMLLDIAFEASDPPVGLVVVAPGHGELQVETVGVAGEPLDPLVGAGDHARGTGDHVPAGPRGRVGRRRRGWGRSPARRRPRRGGSRRRRDRRRRRRRVQRPSRPAARGTGRSRGPPPRRGAQDAPGVRLADGVHDGHPAERLPGRGVHQEAPQGGGPRPPGRARRPDAAGRLPRHGPRPRASRRPRHGPGPPTPTRGGPRRRRVAEADRR